MNSVVFSCKAVSEFERVSDDTKVLYVMLEPVEPYKAKTKIKVVADNSVQTDVNKYDKLIIEGSICSEEYISKSDKTVYNKIIVAKKIAKEE